MRSHGGTTIVLTGLPTGTLTWNCADSGEPATDELELVLRAVPIGGGLVPCLVTKAAEGRKLAGVTPPRMAVHLGTRTTRVPCPCGNWNVTTPGVLVPAVGLVTGAPIPHGGMTTVRAASWVGTTTARMPGVIVLLVLLLLPIAPATARITIRPTMTTRIARLARKLCSGGPAASGSLFSVACAIAVPP